MNSACLFSPKSFSTKIFFLLIIALVCLAMLFNIALISIQKKTYKTSYDAHGATLIRLLAHSIGLAIYTEDKDEMRAPVRGMLQQDDVVEVVIWSANGELLQQKTKDPGQKKRIIAEPMKIPEVLRRDNTIEHKSTETADSFILWGKILFNATSIQQEDWYFDGETNDSDKEVIGYAAVVLSKEFFEKGVRNILFQTGFSVLIFLFASTFATFLIIRKVTEPLRNLILTIRKREEKTEHPSDLKVLTDTYASMVDDLERSFQTISELNEGLEEKVKIRTFQLTKANTALSQRQEELKTSNAQLTDALNQLKETHEQLIQKEKLAAIGQLVAGVAHELNNTVNFISGALPSLHRSLDEMRKVLAGYEAVEEARGSNLLDEKFENIKKIKEELAYDELLLTIDQLMENIDEGTTRTTRIVHDLKIFSREDAEKVVPIDLHTIIDSTLNYIDKQSLQGITIDRIYKALPLVHCLPGRIGQVCLNIMNNSIHAMSETGRLTITTEQRKEYVHIMFSDTGCGIHADDRANIFDPFFTTKEVGLGTGLGLSISYSIIKQHGGDIKVQSNVGEGSTFEIILPIQPKKLSQDI